MKIINWKQFLIFAGMVSCCSLINLSPLFAAPQIEATATTNANNLPILDTGSNTEIRQVANLQVSTDGSNGLKLTINANSLSKIDGVPIPVQFLVVPDGANTPNLADFTVPTISNYEYITNASSANLDLYVKYTPGQLQDPGNYSATLQLSVTDNP